MNQTVLDITELESEAILDERLLDLPCFIVEFRSRYPGPLEKNTLGVGLLLRDVIKLLIRLRVVEGFKKVVMR